MALVAGTTEQTWEWHATVVLRLSQPVPVRMVRPRGPGAVVRTP